MEEKKKSPVGTILLVIIIILLMGACLIGGYLIHEMQDKKDNKGDNVTTVDDNTKEPTQKVYDVTDETVSNLIEKYRVGFDCARLEVFTNDKKVTANDISNDVAYEVAVFNKNDVFTKDTVTVEEATKEVQKYFGKDYKFDPDSLKERKGTCISHYYDKANKQFVHQETACGGTCGPRTSYKLTKAVETDGVLELNTKVIFASWDKATEGYYSDYQKTNKIGTFEEYNELIYDKGSTYKFTFKNEDGNYVFVSSEQV